MGAVYVIGTGNASQAAPALGTADPGTQIGAALNAAVRDAGVRIEDLPGVYICDGDALSPELARRSVGLGPGPADVPQAGGLASAGLYVAWHALLDGAVDAAVVVGASTREYVLKVDPVDPAHHASLARLYMAESGAAREHFAKVVVKNHRHARGSGTRAVVTVEQVLAAAELQWPLTAPMLSEAGSGAAAVILATAAGCRRLGARGPRLRASIRMTGERGADDVQNVIARAAGLAYDAAGIGPDDIDLAEVDDISAVSELVLYELMQFAPAGRGPELIDSGFTDVRGRLPVNVSGGVLVRHRAGPTTSLSQLAYVVRQLRGEAGRQQVDGARLAVSQWSHREVETDQATAFVHVVARD